MHMLNISFIWKFNLSIPTQRYKTFKNKNQLIVSNFLLFYHKVQIKTSTAYSLILMAQTEEDLKRQWDKNK